MRLLPFLLFYFAPMIILAQPTYQKLKLKTNMFDMLEQKEYSYIYRYEDGYEISEIAFEKSNRFKDSSFEKFRSKNYDDAIEDANQSTKYNKKNYDAWYARGIAKGEKGDYQGAVSDITKAIKINPNDAVFYNNRGGYEENLNQFEAAISDYKKAIQLDPNYKAPQVWLKRLEEKISKSNNFKIHMVSVGIGKYQQEYRFNILEFAEASAFSIQNLFQRRNLIQPGEPIINSSAKRNDIIKALESLTDTKNVKENDMVIFFFCGHGLLDDGKIGICPYEYETSDDLITDNEIQEILERSPARHKICFIEACKSDKSADYIDPKTVDEFNRKRLNINPGIVFITSTEVGKKSWGGKKGYFTEAILEALDQGKADLNDDRIITAYELFAYIQPAVKNKTNNAQVPQVNSNYPKNLEIMLLGNY